jgi:rhamnulokinase
VDQPLVNDETLECNLTNEGGVAGTFRLLRNVMGLWLLQECMRAWTGTKAGRPLEQLRAAGFDSPGWWAIVDSERVRRLRAVGVHPRLATLAAENGMVLDMNPVAVVRCMLESLALKYHWVIDKLERITGTPIHTIHVVGGGARNRVLCQMTADAAGRRVLAGPAEATAAGNVMVQAIALGQVGSLAEAREVIRRSTRVEIYEPVQTDQWEAAWRRLVDARGLEAHRRPA